MSSFSIFQSHAHATFCHSPYLGSRNPRVYAPKSVHIGADGFSSVSFVPEIPKRASENSLKNFWSGPPNFPSSKPSRWVPCCSNQNPEKIASDITPTDAPISQNNQIDHTKSIQSNLSVQEAAPSSIEPNSNVNSELPDLEKLNPKPAPFRFHNRHLRFLLLKANLSKRIEQIFESELLRRIIMTVFLLCVSRIGYFIPLPGFDRKIIPSDVFGVEMDVGDVGELKMSLFTLGIMPHILSSSMVQAIIQLNIFPSFSKLRENYGGQERLKKIIWRGTIAASIIMGFATALYYRSYSISYFANKLSYIFIITSLLTLGSLIMDRISESFEVVGFGQGASVLICVNIITSYAESLGSLFSSISKGAISTPESFFILGLSFCFLTSMAAILGSGIRKVYIDYFEFEFFDKPRLNPNPNINQSITQDQNSNSVSISPYIPFYINPSGMTPILYSSCILTFMFFVLSILPGGQGIAKIFSANSTGLAAILHQILFFFLIVRLNIGDSDDSAKRICESLNKMGAYVPGMKSGSQTYKELSRICFSSRLHGGVMLASLTFFSSIIDHKLRSSFSGISIGFTSLLIIVGSIISLRRTFEAYQQMPKLKLVLEKYSQY